MTCSARSRNSRIGSSGGATRAPYRPKSGRTATPATIAPVAQQREPCPGRLGGLGTGVVRVPPPLDGPDRRGEAGHEPGGHAAEVLVGRAVVHGHARTSGRGRRVRQRTPCALHEPPVRVNLPRPSWFRYSTVKDFPSGVKVTPVGPTAFSPAVGKLKVSPS